MIEVLQNTALGIVYFIGGCLALLVGIGPLPAVAVALLGVERWHRNGEPWTLNIGLAILWCITYVSFVFSFSLHYFPPQGAPRQNPDNPAQVQGEPLTP